MNILQRQLQRRLQSRRDSIVIASGDTTVSMAEFVQSIEHIRQFLRSCERPTVALYADNSPQWVMLDLACQFEGVCVIPIPTFFSPAQILHLLDSAAVNVLMCEPALKAALPDDIRPDGDAIELFANMECYRLGDVGEALLPPETAKVTFTSGSTGVPKGVCLSSDQCLQVAASLAQATGLQSPRHLCVLPLATLLENIAGIYAPLLLDGCVVIPSLSELGFRGSSDLDVPSFLTALHAHQPGSLILVPQLLAVLDAALAAGWQAPPSLQFIAVGGGRVAPRLLDRVRARGLPVFEGYGLSECASVVSLNRPGVDRPGTCGQVLPHVQVTSVDGELRVSGNAFLGYLGAPDSWYPQWVETGDLGSVDDDGFVRVSGRRKNVLINTFGRNISPEWVESELCASGLFRQAVVVGDDRPCCAALLVPLDKECPNDEIQRAIDTINRRLPDYARIVRWCRLPQALSENDGLLTANGRPRRERIVRHYSADIASMYEQSVETESP